MQNRPLDSIHLEGPLFVPDTFFAFLRGEFDKESDFKVAVPEGTLLNDEISRAFSIVSTAWRKFQAAPQNDQKKELPKFLGAFFNSLGFGVSSDSFTKNGPPFCRLPLVSPSMPVWYPKDAVESLDAPSRKRFSLDGLSERRRSLSLFVQQWLNLREDALWAVATDGRTLRLFRDNASLVRPSYIEADLARIFSEGRRGDFACLFRLLYRDRAGASGDGRDSVWEKLRAKGADDGVRVFNDLRDGVVKALLHLGNGFLADPTVREAVSAGDLSPESFYHELLRTAYRFLFLSAAEERDALHDPAADPAAAKIYDEDYSMHRLADRCRRASARDAHTDLWDGVRIVFRSLASGEPRLALPALGGIFRASEAPHLDAARLSNRALLDAVRALRWFSRDGADQRIDYRNMGAEELGSVYESLLELVPSVTVADWRFSFVGIPDPLVPAAPARGRRRGGAAGNARKLTGSYYTPSSLVDELVRSTLSDAFLDARLKGLRTPAEREAALLSLAVLDPACGSGHFLLAAARRIAERLAQVRSGEDDVVTPGAFRDALRDVVARCVYGADLNPMAVELAKIALWIETLVPGRPLSFLDAHFSCGNAVIGLLDLKQLSVGIPNDAFAALEGDDPAFCRALAGKNKAVLSSVAEDAKYLGSLFSSQLSSVSSDSAAIDAMPEDTLAQIEAKHAAYRHLLSKAESGPVAQAADLLIAAFLLPKATGAAVPTSADLFGLLGVVGYPEPSPAILQSVARAVAEAKPLHWPFAFPAVFAKGGFDIILGNPPWDVVQFKEEEFFATRNPEIAALAGNERKNAISRLEESDPALWQDYKDHRIAFEHEKSFYSPNTRFPLSAYGKRNLYALFTELTTQLLNPDGRAGLVLQSGIASDDSTKVLFRDLVDSSRLESLFDFENTDGIFPAVHRMFKFCLLTLGRATSADFAFYLHSLPELADKRRHFTLAPSDYALFNPNTLTCPIFRSANDAELAKKIYRKAGVLHRESPSDNPWGIRLWTMFNMTTDSGLFQTVQTPDSLPLYEAKMIDIFDHRYNAFDAPGQEDYHPCSETEKDNPAFEPYPRYWVSREAIIGQFEQDNPIPKYLMGWRKICRAVDSRTTIASVFPFAAAGDSLLLFSSTKPVPLQACLLADFGSLVRDWATRQKIGGINFNFFTMKQLSTLSPSAYTQEDIDFIVPRVLELTYTSYSLKPWAEALGYNGEPFPWDEDRRALLRAELDARYAKLYGLDRDELRYILDPKEATGDPDFPSESFRVLRDDELARFGEYRTRRMVLDAWEAQETPMVVAESYKRTQTWDDSRPTYLRFLVGQMIAQSSTHQMPLTELFSAFSALRTPGEIARKDGMPKGADMWAREYKDAIHDDERLESVLMQMFDAGEISISKSGIVSYVDEGSLHAADSLSDVVIDARMALAFMKLDFTQARAVHVRTMINPLFFRQVTEGAYARAA